jgi:hypothetical protein
VNTWLLTPAIALVIRATKRVDARISFILLAVAGLGSRDRHFHRIVVVGIVQRQQAGELVPSFAPSPFDCFFGCSHGRGGRVVPIGSYVTVRPFGHGKVAAIPVEGANEITPVLDFPIAHRCRFLFAIS